jgi:hypothetical protein
MLILMLFVSSMNMFMNIIWLKINNFKLIWLVMLEVFKILGMMIIFISIWRNRLLIFMSTIWLSWCFNYTIWNMEYLFRSCWLFDLGFKRFISLMLGMMMMLIILFNVFNIFWSCFKFIFRNISSFIINSYFRLRVLFSLFFSFLFNIFR